MSTKTNVRSFMGLVVLCLAAAISMLPITTPATSYFTPVRVIDSHGNEISSNYYGLKPDPRFASWLASITAKRAMLAESSLALRTLTFQDGKQIRCSLLTAAFRNPAPLPPRPGHCNGQYMQPQFYDCLGCDPGNTYEQFASTGTEPCSGYYFPNLIGDCNGCEIAERSCYSC